MLQTESTGGAPAPPARLPGLLLALFGVLLVGAISHHPTLGRVARADVLPQLVRSASLDEAVHAVVILVAIGLLASLSVFTSRLRRMQSVATTGLVVYGVGAGGTLIAALIDGFLIPAIAARYVGASPETLNTVLTVLQVCALTIQIATKFALLATAVAIALWSVTLLYGSSRIVGGLGLAGAGVVVVVLALTNTLNPHNLGAIALLQVGWYVGIGVLMIRGDL